MVAIDNSQYSHLATTMAVDLARRMQAPVTGIHVYAARLHDSRFRQMEPGLPKRYQREDILQHQRDLHDRLIGRGLGLVSDSYLDLFEKTCRDAGVAAHRKTPEGRNYVELVKDAAESRYDLVVLGAHGLGRVDRSLLGSVCERVVRLVGCDVLVVRDDRLPASGPLLVAMDGSPESFGALRVAVELSHIYRCHVEAVAAYDPHFHRVAFESVAGVLSAEASRLFRFKEQERLHDEIIDEGLAHVYRSHLLRAREVAASHDVPLEIQVLEGKPFDAILSYAERLQPSLLLAGRHGMHHADGVTLGSTVENLLRFARCNVLITNRRGDDGDGTGFTAEGGKSKPEVRWSAESQQRLQRIPPFVRNMARSRIEDFARKNGHREITPEVYEQARKHFGM